MDNQEQIREIVKYQQYLARITHTEIDIDTAAQLWIIKFARAWRKLHTYPMTENR